MISICALIGFASDGELEATFKLKVGDNVCGFGDLQVESIWDDTSAQAQEFARVLDVAARLRTYIGELSKESDSRNASNSEQVISTS